MARPPIFENPEQFSEVAEGYFNLCEVKERPYTVNGLALALGMTRETLLRYGEKEGFCYAVKDARARLRRA